MKPSHFNYHNTEVKAQSGGKKIVRKVTIKRGKGYKSVTKYNRGRKTSSIKKPIHEQHIASIRKGKFVPGLFKDCCSREKTKTRKNR